MKNIKTKLFSRADHGLVSVETHMRGYRIIRIEYTRKNFRIIYQDK